ncbi:MAG: hypothetical protein ACREQL_13285 [Candidatus Binatia bacterium]
MARNPGLNMAYTAGMQAELDAVGRTPGEVFFVDSQAANASNNNAGTSWDKPMATVDAAIGLCTANRGDVIYVAARHVETTTAAAHWAADIAGISIIGLGRGSNKPTITLGTSTATDINVSVANVLIRNFRFVNNIDSLVNFLDLDADWCWIEDCDFVTSSAKEAIGFINIATTKDNFFIRRCTFLQPTDPAGTDGVADTGAIFFVDSENIAVEDCGFYGNFETAIIHNRTTAGKNVWVKDCRGVQLLSGAEPFQLVAGCEGGCYGGQFSTPAEAAATEATLVGTLGDKFFISPTTGFGNDGAAGGQGGIVVSTAS